MNARLAPIGRYAEAPADEPEGPCQQAWLDSLSDREFGALVRDYFAFHGYEALTQAVLDATSADFERAMRKTRRFG